MQIRQPTPIRDAKPIRKVAVIGAGTMGAGIAAQVANAGMPVLLLDIVPPGAADRNAVAAGALARMRAADPSPFMSKAAANRVTVGNTEDDLGQLAACDWIVEVIVERLDAKQALYRRIDAVRRPGTPVTSNTSTIPLCQLASGLPEGLARDLLITHFFNPPRHMRLLELVADPRNDPATVAAVSRFADVMLGKSIVACKDTPGFIGNRLGIYWLLVGVREAVAAGLTIEEADAVMGRPLGIPGTGVFGLMDLIGLDLMEDITASLAAALPADDPFQAAAADLPLVAAMVAEGYTGRKGKGGFYRLERPPGGGREKQAKDLATGAYRPTAAADLPDLAAAGSDLRRLLSGEGKAGRYAAAVMGRVLAYAAGLVPSAAADVASVDEAMRLGYAWRRGPFELIDALGASWLTARLHDEGIGVPPALATAGDRPFYAAEGGARQSLGPDGVYRPMAQPDGILRLETVKNTTAPVLKASSAALWDLGDGVACFELTGKGATIDAAAIAALRGAVSRVERDFAAMVIYGDGPHFCLGANIADFLAAAERDDWGAIERVIAAGQEAFAAMRDAAVPVVAAPAGMALGGGCEILLHAAAVQAHAETYAGLVECNIGLVPGWGGGTALATRRPLAAGPVPAMPVFAMVMAGTVSTSAAHARELGILREDDGITMNRSRLLADAKAKALALAGTYAPPPRATPVALGGAAAKAAMTATLDTLIKGGPTGHDATVADALADILSGDGAPRTGEGELHAAERRAFMRLVRTPETRARIAHMLKTGKALRN